MIYPIKEKRSANLKNFDSMACILVGTADHLLRRR